jgi:hypothetical protein
MTTVIIIILVGSVIGGVVITRVKGDQRENRHNYTYLRQELEIMKEAEQNRESRQEEYESRPRKPTAPQPPSYRQPVPPPWLCVIVCISTSKEPSVNLLVLKRRR